MRPHSPAVYAGLKSAFRRLLRECGDLREASQVTRVGKTMLAEYGSMNHPDTYPPADVIADLEAHVGAPIVSRQLVRLAADLANTSATDDMPGDDIAALLHMTTRGQVALGDLAQCAIQAAADGDLDNAELNALIAKAEARMMLAQSDHDTLLRLREVRRGKPRRRPKGASQ